MLLISLKKGTFSPFVSIPSLQFQEAVDRGQVLEMRYVHVTHIYLREDSGSSKVRSVYRSVHEQKHIIHCRKRHGYTHAEKKEVASHLKNVTCRKRRRESDVFGEHQRRENLHTELCNPHTENKQEHSSVPRLEHNRFPFKDQRSVLPS